MSDLQVELSKARHEVENVRINLRWENDRLRWENDRLRSDLQHAESERDDYAMLVIAEVLILIGMAALVISISLL